MVAKCLSGNYLCKILALQSQQFPFSTLQKFGWQGQGGLGGGKHSILVNASVRKLIHGNWGSAYEKNYMKEVAIIFFPLFANMLLM